MKTVRYSNGYKVIYEPMNTSSMTSKNWNGWIYEHIKVAEKMYGRKVLDGEEVHHKDFDKLNNSEDNLEILTSKEHMRLHHSSQRKCVCGKIIRRKRHTFCSKDCRYKHTTKFPGCDELKTIIADKKPFTQIATNIGVSSNAIKKWCIKCGLI